MTPYRKPVWVESDIFASISIWLCNIDMGCLFSNLKNRATASLSNVAANCLLDNARVR